MPVNLSSAIFRFGGSISMCEESFRVSFALCLALFFLRSYKTWYQNRKGIEIKELRFRFEPLPPYAEDVASLPCGGRSNCVVKERERMSEIRREKMYLTSQKKAERTKNIEIFGCAVISFLFFSFLIRATWDCNNKVVLKRSNRRLSFPIACQLFCLRFSRRKWGAGGEMNKEGGFTPPVGGGIRRRRSATAGRISNWITIYCMIDEKWAEKNWQKKTDRIIKNALIGKRKKN